MYRYYLTRNVEKLGDLPEGHERLHFFGKEGERVEAHGKKILAYGYIECSKPLPQWEVEEYNLAED